MDIMQFDLDTLKEIDGGKPALAFRKQLDAALADCVDRGVQDQAARKVTMEISLTPVPADGVVDEVRVDIAYKTGVPKFRTKMYSMGIRNMSKDGKRQRMLVFNPMSPDNVNQSTFDAVDGEKS